MTRVKCCGLMKATDIETANCIRPDYCGFIIDFPKSHRSLTPEQVAKLVSALDSGIVPVAVLVNATLDRATEIARVTGVQALQLHGNESNDYVDALRERTNCAIWRAFSIRTGQDLAVAAASTADLLVLDNGRGTGKTFDWSLAKEFKSDYKRDFLLAGGLTVENIPRAIAQVDPFGIDISSGIETDKVKDPEKMRMAVCTAHGVTSQTDKYVSDKGGI